METLKYIIINSYDRPNQNESDTNFNLGVNGGSTFAGLSQVGILRFVCTNSIYNVDSSNNFIKFQENTGPEVTAIIPNNGNYSLNNLITALQTAMDLVSPNSRTYTITSSVITNKITISSTGSFTIKADQGLGLNLMLGFSRRSDSSTGIAITAPRIFNLNRFSSLVIKSNLVRGDTYNTVVGNREGILDTVPISDAYSGDIFTYEKDFIAWRDLSYNAIEQINIRVVDDKDKEVNLNGGFLSVYLVLR